MSRNMSLCKKILPIFAACILLSVFVVPTYAPPPSDLLSQILTEIATAVSTITSIGDSLEGWLGIEGTYNQTAQVEVVGGSYSVPKATAVTIIQHNDGDLPSIPKSPEGPMNVKITIGNDGMDIDAVLRFIYRVGTDTEYTTIFIGLPRNDVMTIDVCATSFKINAEAVANGFEVWYNYLVTYEP